MKYLGTENFSHKKSEKIGVLIANLGTPSAPTKKELKKYLKIFLSDKRVIEVPTFFLKILWFFVLNFIILITRPKKSAKKYQSIWQKEGSPLLVYCQKILQKISLQFSGDFVFALGMSYGEPSINKALDDLRRQNCKYLFVLPLYPQYSGSTSASVFDTVSSYLQKIRWIPHFYFLHSYHDEPLYISAIEKSIKKSIKKNKQSKILFSYHGTPLRYLLEGDPYHCQCHKTTRLVAKKMNLKEKNYLTCFQSRFGKEEWLQPYTDKTLEKLAKTEKEIFVICTGFAVDCLETLEEMADENKEIFLKAGGEKYYYIPCLNDSKEQIKLLCGLIKKYTKDWTISKEKQKQEELKQKLTKQFSFYKI